MIRADMDALPLAEATGLDFASTHKGVMHACGHDAHMAMVLGAATALNRIKDRLTGNIKFIFQPAEEGPGGAKPMIEAGAMEDPVVDFCVGCHVWPEIPEGTIGVKTGPFMAAMDRFDIKIIGKGGHGAMPHLCVDALEVGVQVVNALQRIVSRQMDPLEPSVVTVGSFHSGSAYNVIPGEAELSGTTRTFSESVWNSWENRLERVIQGVCKSMGADFEFTFIRGHPPVVNDPFMADIVRQAAEQTVGKENVVEPSPAMVGEDFSFFLQKARGCFIALGVGRKDAASIHHPRFDFNEDVMMPGVETYCRICLNLLP
jgi:amidohydrolase